MAAALERELDALYQLPLDQFTAARSELAKRLRADGQADQAEQVKALRKPTVAVWLVNRLAREDELDVQRLLRAGESLTKTQAKVAQGQSPEGFLETRREEEQALKRLTRAARSIADREGVGSSAIDRATQTLRAASLTDEGRRLLKQGRLTEELQPPGFEALAGVDFASPKRESERSQKAATHGDRRRALREVRDSLQHLRAEERELRTVARAAARAAERAETEARRKRAESDRAKSDADEATSRVDAADAELERLRRRPASQTS
jgi:hypothetical protein